MAPVPPPAPSPSHGDPPAPTIVELGRRPLHSSDRVVRPYGLSWGNRLPPSRGHSLRKLSLIVASCLPHPVKGDTPLRVFESHRRVTPCPSERARCRVFLRSAHESVPSAAPGNEIGGRCEPRGGGGGARNVRSPLTASSRRSAAAPSSRPHRPRAGAHASERACHEFAGKGCERALRVALESHNALFSPLDTTVLTRSFARLLAAR